MQRVRSNINLVDSDFEGIDVKEVMCTGCNGPMCGDKTPKLYNGELIFVCHMRTPGNTVLRRAAARTNS